MTKVRPFDAADHLTTPVAAVTYAFAALETFDPETIALATETFLRAVIKHQLDVSEIRKLILESMLKDNFKSAGEPN